MTTDRYKLDLFYSKDLRQQYEAFQERTEDVKKVSHLQLSLLAMHFPKTSMKRRKGIEQDWIETLPTLKNVKALYVRHRVDQEFFEAICRMPNLTCLQFISSNVADITSLTKLKKLERLDLHGFSKLTDIKPVTSLKKLRLLSVLKCFKVENYQVLGQMTQLHGLTLGGDLYAPRNLPLKSLVPFETLTNLRHLDIGCLTVKDKSFLSILKLKSLERLDLLSEMPDEIREQIKSGHKKLKAGFFMDWDFKKKQFLAGKKW